MPIYFYGTKSKPYGCFSNFSSYSFELDGKKWKTSEHYFQAQKFLGTEYYDKVHAAKTPKEAAKLGRNRKFPLRKDWDSVKEDVMRKALEAKFTQNPKIREVLISSKDELIVEKSPTDFYWGCGNNGSGKNRLGLLLVELRESLIKKA